VEARYQQTRGRLVIFDRYPYDALLPARTRLSRRGAARRWLLGHSLPPPDLTVVLDVPATVLHARKSEQAVATLARERLAYVRLARTLRRAVVVDATGPADQVRRTVTALIWQSQARRWNSRWGVRPLAVGEQTGRERRTRSLTCGS
jgi:thymidylate kinase